MMKNSKENKTALPELRFPEFMESEGWKETTLAKCLNYQQPTPYLVLDTDYNDSYETPVLTAGKTFILGFTNEQFGVFRDNLPVIIFDDFTTATQFVDFPFKAKSSAMKILLAKKGVHIKFMYEAMQGISYGVGVHERHWISRFAPMPILIPALPEQKKIAECFGSLDDLISAVADKIKALRKHKKGLMPQLFPAEGKTTPALRFLEFRDSGEWKETTLGECLDYEQPTPYLISDTNYNNDYETPVLTAGKSFILGYTNEQEGIYNHRLPVIIFDDFTTATQFVDFPFKAKSSAMKILRAKKCIDIKFMYETIQTISYQVGVHERHWISRFIPLKVLIPNPAEQQKIANCLSSIDEQIMAEQQKLDQLKAHKKGLMQRLFPKL